MTRTLACALAAVIAFGTATAVLGGDAGGKDKRVIAGRVVDEYDHPLAKWNVEFVPVPGWMPGAPHGVTDADGRFRLPASPRILYRVQVGPAGTWPGPPVTEPLRGGTTDLKLVVKPDRMRHARVHCRIVSPDGVSLPQVHAFLEDEGGGSAFFTFDAKSGEGVSGRVEPGVYTVCASDPVCGWFAFPPFEVKDAADVDAGTLTFPRFGVARLVPSLPHKVDQGHILYHVMGVVAPKGWRRWWDGMEFFGMGKVGEFTDASAVDCSVTPGKYLVVVEGISVQQIERTIEGRSGEVTTVPLAVRAPPMRSLRLHFPGVLPEVARLEILEPTGEATWTGVVAEGSDTRVRLAPGTYRLAVEADDQRRFTADLVVPEDPNVHLDVKLTLASAAPASPR